MGRRSGTETIVAILACFVRRRSWQQAALAREAGVTVKALRTRLDELTQYGIRVERFAESGRDVRWDVPPGWFPDARGLTDDETATCIRLLGRLPRSRSRDTLLARLTGRAAAQLAREAAPDEGSLAELEDACRASRPVQILYDAASTGLGVRVVTVHRLVYDSPTRFVATSHERDRLAWYRVDRVRRVDPAPGVRAASVSAEVIDAYVRESADGFHQGRALRCSFVVRDPEARWVVENLPVEGAKTRRVAEAVDGAGGVEVLVDTAGVEVLARFVVGLGAAARATSDELAARVEAIALGALEARAAGPEEKAATGATPPVDCASAARRGPVRAARGDARPTRSAR